MKLADKLKLPEGRRLEFKEMMPSNADFAKTVIAFANDAGGELYIGIKNNPRLLVGIPENQLDGIENKISNIIHDACTPIVQPEISFLTEEDKYVIRVYIHKGSKPPYFLKNKGKNEGTFIRVGSSNRLGDIETIFRLERSAANISFDSELNYSKDFNEIALDEFATFFKEKTGEELTDKILEKLDLVVIEQGQKRATNALLLLSNDKLKTQLFPNSKIECARFKGTKPGNFIDQKSFSGSIVGHAELALNFVKRHISEGTKNYEGVYRNDRWEYPIIALREVIRNAIIHRDYSLTGKDIKIAIFDDKIEITSPGKLMPTVDFDEMFAGQSDVRNKVLAPVFKRLGLIEQWGNGLQLIADDLKAYPEIKLNWNEPGTSFRVAFINQNYLQQQELQQELKHELQHELEYELQHELQHESLFTKVLKIISFKEINTKGIATVLEQKSISGQLKKTLSNLLENVLIEWTIPEKPNSKNQQYRITNRGIVFLQLLNQKNKPN